MQRAKCTTLRQLPPAQQLTPSRRRPGCSAAFLLERRRNRRRSSEQHPNGDPQADDREDAHRPGAPMPLPRMPGGPPRPRKPPAKPSPPGAPAQGAPTGSPSQPPIGGGPKPPAGSHGSAPAGPPYGPPGGPHVAACARAAAARARASSSLRTRSKFAKYISSWICAPRGRAHRPTMCRIIPWLAQSLARQATLGRGRQSRLHARPPAHPLAAQHQKPDSPTALRWLHLEAWLPPSGVCRARAAAGARGRRSRRSTNFPQPRPPVPPDSAGREPGRRRRPGLGALVLRRERRARAPGAALALNTLEAGARPQGAVDVMAQNQLPTGQAAWAARQRRARRGRRRRRPRAR